MQQKDVSVKSVKKGSHLLKAMTGWRKSGSVGAQKLEVLMDKLASDWDKNLKSKPAELADHEIILGYSPMVAFKFKVVSCVQMDQRKALVLQRCLSLLQDQIYLQCAKRYFLLGCKTKEIN